MLRRYAPRGFESFSRIVSLPSSMASSSTGTATVFAVSPAAKVSAPDAAAVIFVSEASDTVSPSASSTRSQRSVCALSFT